MQRRHVVGQASQAQPKHPRSHVGNPALAENDKASGVRDEMKPRKPLIARPADPGVARADLEGPHLPADQSNLGLPACRHLAKRAAVEILEGKIVVARGKGVPSPRGKVPPLFELETCMPRRVSNQMLRCRRKIQFRNKN